MFFVFYGQAVAQVRVVALSVLPRLEPAGLVEKRADGDGSASASGGFGQSTSLSSLTLSGFPTTSSSSSLSSLSSSSSLTSSTSLTTSSLSLSSSSTPTTTSSTSSTEQQTTSDTTPTDTLLSVPWWETTSSTFPESTTDNGGGQSLETPDTTSSSVDPGTTDEPTSSSRTNGNGNDDDDDNNSNGNGNSPSRSTDGDELSDTNQRRTRTFDSVQNGSTVIVTQTSVYTSNGSSSPTGTNRESDSSGGGLSQTNKIVVGVVVGVGGAILLAIAALVFLIKRRGSRGRESGWTFWRKGEKGDGDDFFDGELGVRDRNINQGLNF